MSKKPEDFPNLDAIFDEKAIDKATWKANLSASMKGKVQSEEHRAKLGALRKGRKMSEEQKAKLGTANKGRKRGPQSEEHRAKLSAAKKGKKPGSLSEEAKANMSAAALTRKRTDMTCTHCGKTMMLGAHNRYHGDNCKDHKA
jgi:hypothetical protein